AFLNDSFSYFQQHDDKELDKNAKPRAIAKGINKRFEKELFKNEQYYGNGVNDSICTPRCLNAHQFHERLVECDVVRIQLTVYALKTAFKSATYPGEKACLFEQVLILFSQILKSVTRLFPAQIILK